MATVAHAYAPTPSFILELVAQKRVKQKLNAMRITVRRTEFVNGVAGAPHHVTTTFREGGRLRREWTDSQGVKHARVTDKAKTLVVDGENKGLVAATPDLMDALWATGASPAERDAAHQRGVALLKAWGVHDGVVSFARTDGRIAWVLGAPSQILDVPQVWVDKDDLLPLRVLRPELGAVPPPTDGGPVQKAPLVDERLREWGSAVGGEFYPARVETYRNSALVQLDELLNVDVTPKIDEREFKVD
jgi:hypothetical protein